MAADLSNGNVPADGAPNTAKPPEHVEGFIDLQILIDIHKCLSESNSDLDRALAVWVKTNYLQEPLNVLEEAARPIRDAEGFVNLDKAYRRARQLTGKAQDKWPFFNKNLKKLSSTLVKNAILGDAGMGAIRSEGREAYDTTMSNGFDGHLAGGLQNPESKTSLSANDISRHHTQEPRSPQLAKRLQNHQDIGHETLRRDDSPVSRTSSWLKGADVDDTVNGTPSPMEELRDLEAGKVRGPDGRYMIKDNHTLPINKSNAKQSKKSITTVAPEGASEGISESGDEEVKDYNTKPRAIPALSEGGKETAHDSNEPPMNEPSAAGPTLNLATSAILAAEAEPVPSNLDRLPPGFTHKKRKSDSSIPSGDPKRSRGSRGGVLGRPRKSETLTDRARPELKEDVKLARPKPTQSEDPGSTRRSSRKSTASALESSTPWDPTDDVLFGGSSQKQPARNSNIAQTNGTIKALDSAEVSGTSDRKHEAENKTKDSKFGNTDTTTTKPLINHTKTQKAPTSTKRKKRVSFSPETQTGGSNLEFFARITTAAGTQDVALLREDLTHEVDLVERYAEWQLAGNASVSFEVFKNIVKFARPG